MKVISLPMEHIKFQYISYPSSLSESLNRIGQNFPIKVKKIEDQYIVIDGNKRMSAIYDLLETKQTQRFQTVKVIVVNDARTASGTPMNFH